MPAVPMSASIILAFALMAFVSSITPGPNNLMLMASGLNHGLRRSIPHLLGVNLGFFFMCIGIAFGLAEVFVRAPIAEALMRWAGAAYLAYLAARIATASPPAQSEGQGPARGRPLGFVGAALFQWVNPKAWAMALGAFGAYVPAGAGAGTLVGFALLFAVINAPCILAWTVFGIRMRESLRRPALQRGFNRAMGLLLLASLWPLLAAGGP